MDRYIDIQLRPDPEFTPPRLMNALFSKLHRALVEIANERIGVSFPDHEIRPRSMGGRLRLHGDESNLQHLMATPWLTGMRDHIHVRDMAAVPAGHEFRMVRRVQAKTNAERIRRRHMRRHQTSYEEARDRIPDSIEAKVDLPFVTLRSKTNGHGFALFIAHQKAEGSRRGGFNTFGLSAGGTVPWF